MVNLFTEPLIREHGYLFSNTKKQMLNGQLTIRIKGIGNERAADTSQPALLNRVPFGKFNRVNCLKKDTHTLIKSHNII